MKRPAFFYEGDQGGGSGGEGAAGGAPASSGGGTLLGDAGSAAGGAGAATGAVQVSAGLVGEDGTFSADWLEKVAPDLKGNPSLSVIRNVKDLAQSYVHTKGLIGKKLEAPGQDATPEQVASWRKTVGAPEAVEGYYPDGTKSLRPDVVPEGLWDAAGERKFLEVAHKHHLPPAAVKDILAYYGDSIAQSVQASEATQAQVMQDEGNKLRTEWGTNYDANLALAARVAATVGLNPKEDQLFTSAAAVKAFAQMGKLLSEDKLVTGQTNGINGSIAQRAHDITDPKSTSALARDYRGENGLERQTAAQAQLHQLMAASQQG